MIFSIPEEILSFSSSYEFNSFLKWIESQISKTACREIKKEEFDNNYFRKRRFMFIDSTDIWVLSYPDPGYFNGSWMKENEAVV